MAWLLVGLAALLFWMGGRSWAKHAQRRRARRSRCRHVWSLRGANRGRSRFVVEGMGYEQDYTEALWVCDVCGCGQARQVSGHWTVEQLAPRRPAAEVVDGLLREVERAPQPPRNSVRRPKGDA